MDLELGNTVVLDKTRELCQTIVGQPAFRNVRTSIDRFLADDQAREQYQLVAEKGEQLMHKQHQGLHLTNEEISDYERHRESLVGNPVARDFLAAQEQIQRVQETVTRYVAKTLELGRVPEEDDFLSCAPGCKCGH
jgi:cell fate (sporulation/competence/biofilm development) regulator YlbF (YheA/YmcA/DUF963 family)